MNTLFTLNLTPCFVAVLEPASTMGNMWDFGSLGGICMVQKVRWLKDS